MNRIGIRTFSRVVVLYNYGTFLQHFALRVVLRRIGYEPYRLEAGSWTREGLTLLMPLRALRIRLLTLLGRAREGIGFVASCGFVLRRLKFIRDFRRHVGCVFEKQSDDGVFAYVVGSDQIWNDRNDEAFLLNCPAGVRRIAYAVSADWRKYEKDGRWRDYVRRFGASAHAIGVREDAGVKLVSEITGRSDVVRVVDPTLLLQRSDYLASLDKDSIFKRPTMFAYLLNIGTEEELGCTRLEEMAKTVGCSLRIDGSQGADGFVPQQFSVGQLGPMDFLREIRDAEYVVTNSFHGLVFCILFHRKFVFVRQHVLEDGNQNRRQEELLEMLGLSDRIGVDVDIRSPIDWKRVDAVVALQRTKSLNWLEEALK